jgi:pilus assembly protein TadC
VLFALAAGAGDGADAGVVVSAVAAAGALGWLSRRSGSGERRRRAALAAELPATADLLAMCLMAGATPSDALDAVAGSTGGPLADRLRQVAGALRVGATHGEAWAVVAADDPLAPMVRAFIRSDASGAPVAETLAAVADEQRRVARWAAEAAARRAGVHAVGPLAVCFLPAFVLTGVVPVILAVATEVLGGLQ